MPETKTARESAVRASRNISNHLLRGRDPPDVFSSRPPPLARLAKSLVGESEQSPRGQEALFAEMVRNENVSHQRNGSNALSVAAILTIARRNETMRFE